MGREGGKEQGERKEERREMGEERQRECCDIPALTLHIQAPVSPLQNLLVTPFPSQIHGLQAFVVV